MKTKNNVSALELIDIAKAKGYSISRNSLNHYQTHRVENEKHVTRDFHGNWRAFVKHVNSL